MFKLLLILKVISFVLVQVIRFLHVQAVLYIKVISLVHVQFGVDVKVKRFVDIETLKSKYVVVIVTNSDPLSTIPFELNSMTSRQKDVVHFLVELLSL
jgi:hypothetical protein